MSNIQHVLLCKIHLWRKDFENETGAISLRWSGTRTVLRPQPKPMRMIRKLFAMAMVIKPIPTVPKEDVKKPNMRSDIGIQGLITQTNATSRPSTGNHSYNSSKATGKGQSTEDTLGLRQVKPDGGIGQEGSEPSKAINGSGEILRLLMKGMDVANGGWSTIQGQYKEGFKGLEQDKDSTRITGQKSRGYRIK
ncbi:hypothetical protein PPACK8108_LOCUS1611 [Phakopsora pachyrhizi]|uniref:Uncharacterized protein n=1 Tax=Phakopsora pachyrhizi TaxID=170000 RepID=A0AAV0AJ86_PHAPC|nr:hypothetical protein PPACK8108_LOCUS1611 [Phakopsora pachyrhizi]